MIVDYSSHPVEIIQQHHCHFTFLSFYQMFKLIKRLNPAGHGCDTFGLHCGRRSWLRWIIMIVISLEVATVKHPAMPSSTEQIEETQKLHRSFFDPVQTSDHKNRQKGNYLSWQSLAGKNTLLLKSTQWGMKTTWRTDQNRVTTATSQSRAWWNPGVCHCNVHLFTVQLSQNYGLWGKGCVFWHSFIQNLSKYMHFFMVRSRNFDT